MLPQEIIRKKRDGETLSAAEVADFIAGVTSGAVSEGQVAAFCMALFYNKMDLAERVALAKAMTDSGTVIGWDSVGLDGPILDKHSTGGIGDKVSLILGPALAAAGAYCPMISGRGLGHTGGTLDKLEAIPGYRVDLSIPEFQQVVKKAGCAIVSASADLAPADRRIYAIRDVTATVESLDLITASILSKKLAAGLENLVMDVKFGSGAFMAKFEDAVALAESIAHVATGAGLPCTALLTDMNEVLGHAAGNAVEVAETIDILTGKSREPRLYGVTRELTAELYVMGGLAPDLAAARTLFDKLMDGGHVAQKFADMVVALGGPADLLDNPARLPAAPVVMEIFPDEAGTVTAMDARAIGMMIVAMGGGRAKPGDKIHHGVGLTGIAPIGTEVARGGRPLAWLHAASLEEAQAAAARLKAAITIGDAAPAERPLVARRVTGGATRRKAAS